MLLVHCVFMQLRSFGRHVGFVYQSINMFELCLLCSTKYLAYIGNGTLIYREQFQFRHSVSSSSCINVHFKNDLWNLLDCVK